MNGQNNMESKEWLAFFEISQALSSTLVIDDLLELILQSAKKLIRADRGSIMLFDKKEKKLRVTASFGMEDKNEIIKGFQTEGGIAAKVIAHKKPFLLKGDMNDMPLLKNVNRREEIKSALSVPLTAKGEIVGVFNLTRLTIETSFDERELSLLTMLAGPAAIAISNAHLYQRIQNMALYAKNERDKLQAILENISNGILIYGKNRIILLFNPMAAKILHIDKNTLNTIIIDGLFRQREDLEPVYELLSRFDMSDARLIEQELSINIQGEIVYLKMTCIRVYSQDNKGDWITILILEDHTRMVQTQKIAVWQGMARLLAHEIKNPLTPILWSAESLLDPDVRKSPEFIKIVEENSNSIIKEVKRLQELVSKFSSFAKMPEPVLKTDRIERVLEETTAMYSNINVRIKKIFQPDAPMVRIDAGMMKQVFINLIKNSIEAMSDGGDLTITTVSLDGIVLIEFTDTGVGIPPDIQDKIFDPYFTTKESGSGLGLTLCSKVISDHGGQMKVISRENEGTTIMITLPADKGEDNRTKT
ncbi:MAG: GAF domain-containing protein [Nitrospinae bacterium]|nr:GAF domain-containing protein [Nitrospinota bacterium]